MIYPSQDNPIDLDIDCMNTDDDHDVIMYPALYSSDHDIPQVVINGFKASAEYTCCISITTALVGTSEEVCRNVTLLEAIRISTGNKNDVFLLYGMKLLSCD